ncbi:Uncharacterised protein g10079 [Pycnogonum litorale]
MASKIYEFEVEMTCEGCSGAVNRVLGKHQGNGINKFEVDLQTKKVSVESSLSADELLEIIKKTGKATRFIGVKDL